MEVSHNEPLEQTSETLPTGSEPSPSLPIQPTPSPVAPVIDDNARYRMLLEGTIKAQNERIAQMERDRVTAPTTPVAPPKTADEDRQEYFNNPKEATRQLIREELQQTIAPLTDFVKSFKGASAIDKLVEAAQLNPQFRGHWSPSIEQYVREQASQVDPAKLNDSTFGFLVISAIGAKTTGLIRDNTAPVAPTPTPTPTPAPVATPPYMAPSAPPTAAPRSNQPSFKPLDETEKRLVREYNLGKPANRQMSEQQFREWQEVPSESVISSAISQPKPAGT